MLLISRSFFAMALVPGLFSCHTVKQGRLKLTAQDKVLADSLLRYALDHEALYTLLDTLKPMSSVKFLKFRVAKDSGVFTGSASIPSSQITIGSIALYTRLCSQLSSNRKQFIIVPFERTDNGLRNMEIYVVDKKRFASIISQHASYFGQFGITTEMDPAQVITIIKYENKYDRWRGYGYLFGYPGHAVDFFVQAGKQQDSTGTFVSRTFFQKPVYAGKDGFFTYAVPKDYAPTIVHSALYRHAASTLKNYQATRKSFQNGSGLKAVKLFNKLKN